MSKTAISQFAQPRIDARALLGLYDPADATDWGPIRAAQLHAGRQFAIFLLAANVIGAALIVNMAAVSGATWRLQSWAAMVAAVSCSVVFRRLRSRDRTASSATVQDVRSTAWEGVALGAIWAALPAYVLPRVHADTMLGVWTVMAVLMAANAVGLAGLPLSTLAFLGILGSAVATAAYLHQGATVAALLALFTILVVITCYDRARALVILRANEIAIAERDDTVALLLRDTDSENHDADWLWEIDAARRIVRASPRFAYAVGLDPIKINQMPILQLLAGDRWENGDIGRGLKELAERLKQRETFRGLVVEVFVKGECRFWELAASPRYDEANNFIGFRGVGSDVTQALASADKINRMARFDALTGLPNRLLLNETLAKAIADAERWGSRTAFMMIDLDRFKAVNDTLGHPVGDRLLGRVSERLGALMTDGEMVGRLGGDEFAIVVADATDTAKLERLAARVIDSLSQPYEIDHHTLYIGASVGMAIGPRDGRNAEMLVRSADLALYRAKDAGGGVAFFYEPQLHVQAEERRIMEIALREAVRNGELSLAYQPVVSATDGSLISFEALMRWTHPKLGAVSPAKFIPLAEDARLIVPMGEWALRTACEEAAQWPGSTVISVNVSPEQLTSASFLTTLTSALANSGLSPERLELEVTESVFLRDSTTAHHVLTKIIDLGVKLALDDFGTGYSSLGYLSRTRFSTIKVDKSFVNAAAAGENEALAIIRAVVAMARSLGITTTAEGVENEEQLRLVQELGCTKIQGFLFGRPVPAKEARGIIGHSRDRSRAA